MKIYIATSLENWKAHNEVRGELWARGHTITYDWTTHGPVFSHGLVALQAVAIKEAAGVVEADAAVILWPGGRGTHVELGIAIAAGIPIFFMSPMEAHHQATYLTCAFYHYPRVQLSKSLDAMYVQLDTYARNFYAPANV